MKIITALLVLLMVALAVDRGAEHVAERIAAGQARDRLGLPGALEVEVGGFPFLTQLVTGDFEEVRAQAHRVPLGRLIASRLTVTAHGVTADYSRPSASRARRVLLRVLLSYEQIGHVAPEGVRVGPAGRKALRVTAPLDIPGRTVTSRSRVRVENGAVLVRARRIWVNGTPLADTGLNSRIQGRLDFSVPLDALPSGLTVTDVRAGPAGVEVFGRVRDLALVRLGRVGG